VCLKKIWQQMKQGYLCRPLKGKSSLKQVKIMCGKCEQEGPENFVVNLLRRIFATRFKKVVEFFTKRVDFHAK
jgi:hypothetical protein